MFRNVFGQRNAELVNMMAAVDKLAEILSNELEVRTKSPIHAYRFICCEMDGASQGDTIAQQLVKYSSLLPCEYDNALVEDELMDERDSPSEFINKVTINMIHELPVGDGIEGITIIRCATIKKYIERNKIKINKGRRDFARQQINQASHIGDWEMQEQWQEILDKSKF